MKVKNNSLIEIETNLQEISVFTGDIVEDRPAFGKLVANRKFAYKPNIRTNKTCTEENAGKISARK